MRLCRRGIEDLLVGAAQLYGVKPSACVHESVAGMPFYHAPVRLQGRMYAASTKCLFFFDAWMVALTIVLEPEQMPILPNIQARADPPSV